LTIRKLFEQETLTQQAQTSISREEDRATQAEASLEEQKTLFGQLEARLVDQAAATDSAEAYLVYLLLKEDDVVHYSILQDVEINSLQSLIRDMVEQHSADLASFEAMHAKCVENEKELASPEVRGITRDPELVDPNNPLLTPLRLAYEENALLEKRLVKTERSDDLSGTGNVCQRARITTLETEIDDFHRAHRQECDGYESRITELQENHTLAKDLIGLLKSNSSTEAGRPTSFKCPTPSRSESAAKRSRPSMYPASISEDDVQEISSPRSDGYYECLIPDDFGQLKYTLKPNSLLSAKSQEQLKATIVKLDKWGQSRKQFRWQSLGQTDNNTCSMRKSIHKSSDWVEVNRACRDCTLKRQPCLVVHTVDGKDRAVLLPLLAEDRKALSPFDPGYWIKQ